MHNTVQKSIPLLVLILFIAGNTPAKTRWSTFHCIPDADLLEGGSLLLNLNGYYLFNSGDGSAKAKPAGMLTLGIIEWVNISGGYAGGPLLGMKMRILGETKDWMPSVALGVRNIFSNRDSYYFGQDEDSLTNEIYCAIGKGIENLRLRMNLGIMSIPTDKNDKVNFFIGAEKYFGNGLYLSLEFFRRQKEFVTSIFVDWRIVKRKIEIYGGAVDITGLATKDKNSSKFVQPGVNAGVRFLLNVRRGKSGGFTTLEDQLRTQNKTIQMLQNDVDSMRALLNKGTKRIDGLSESFRMLADDSTSELQQYRVVALEKLAALRNLYEQEPFEPDQVKSALQELAVHREKIIPVLIEVALNKKEDTQIRTLATSICGEIRNSASADALIEILSQTHIPEIKIEALIALGKLKDVRAAFLMQQLSSDPNDAVAFTAMEVLQKLEKETGIPITSVNKETIPENSIPERKIGVKTPEAKDLSEIINETTFIDSEMKLQKVEKRNFSEIAIESKTVDSLVDTLSNQNSESSYSNAKVDTLDSGDLNHSDTVETSGKETVPADTLVSNGKMDNSSYSSIKGNTNSPDIPKKNKKKREKTERKKVDESGSW